MMPIAITVPTCEPPAGSALVHFTQHQAATRTAEGGLPRRPDVRSKPAGSLWNVDQMPVVTK
uniref:Uncharacterized protein n=1 Tax=Aotus nancymaae TaxID=37293 RepID=A0A2K5F1J8_AOTNA